MELAEFLDGELKGRGAQSRLAEALGVSKSTITHWRRGGKPGFVKCLLMSLYFDVAPEELFAMVGDEEYVKFYQQLFPEGAPPDVFALLRDPSHREIHRKLQAVLVGNSDAAQMVVSVIEMAARQMEARALLEQAKGKAAKEAVSAAFQLLVLKQKGRKSPKKDRRGSKRTPKGR